MFKQILEYQKIDGKILSLKRESDNDPARQNLNKLSLIGKEYQNKLVEVDSSAKKAIADYEKCKAEYEKLATELEKLNKQNFDNMSVEDLNSNVEKISALASHLAILERTLSAQVENINNILKNFDACKNNIVLYKQKYKQEKEKCSSLDKSLAPQIKVLEDEMKKLAKDIEPKLLGAYNNLRKDNIFPVFVPLNNNSCGGCSMSIPAALMNKLKEKGYLECEQCRRYIFTE